MKKRFLFLLVFLFVCQFLKAESFTIYTGTTSGETPYFGASIGGNILHFVQMQLDVFKYLKQDESLHSDIPFENRGDFLGASLNFALKIPINLLPYLDRLDYIQPYILVGYGYCLENLAGEYMDVPDRNDKTGVFSKIRQFDSFGYGIVIMVASKIGIKIDYRSIRISEHEKMEYSYRKFNRFSFGLCFGWAK